MGRPYWTQKQWAGLNGREWIKNFHMGENNRNSDNKFVYETIRGLVSWNLLKFNSEWIMGEKYQKYDYYSKLEFLTTKKWCPSLLIRCLF